ncbi:MAG TPA: hypothetical protein VFM82_10275 [Flavobacteriaceae bacterium]|nr:hypothetical protein [Flavobacteriaceae bacterium]
MENDLKKEGNYELFKTNRGHQIINFNDNDFYALVKGQQGDIIVKSDDNHEKEKTLSSGKFYYADFSEDPDFQDMPHLFLEDGDEFKEMILPEGLPKEKDYQKKLVRTDKKVPKDKILEHVK